MKIKKEIINYLVFGVLTTLVNIISFGVLTKLLTMDYRIATTIAWILSVIFAFITNKLYVFNSGGSMWKEFFSFLVFRLLSYFLDLGMMILMVELLNIDSFVAKIVANVFVVVANYFASKYIIFKP